MLAILSACKKDKQEMQKNYIESLFSTIREVQAI